MRLLLLSALFFVELNLNNCKDYEVIVDFLKNQTGPTKLTSFLCWNKDEIVNFEKTLHSVNIFSANYENYITHTFTPEYQFYLLDLNCEHAENVMAIAEREQRFNYPYRWMVLEDCAGVKSVKDINMVINSRIYVLNMC